MSVKLCLCESGTLSDINVCKVESGLIAAVLISNLLQLEVSVSDIYPQLVCLECLKKLTDFQTFKDSCWKAKVNFDTLCRNTAFPDVYGPGGRCDGGDSAGANTGVPTKTCEDYSDQCTKVYVEETNFLSDVVIKEEPIEESHMKDPLRLEPPYSEVREIPEEDITIKEEEIQVNSGMGREDTQDPLYVKQPDSSSKNCLYREISSTNGLDCNPNQVTSKQLEENNLANETIIDSNVNNMLSGSLVFLPAGYLLQLNLQGQIQSNDYVNEVAQNGGNVVDEMQMKKEGTSSTVDGMEMGKEGKIPTAQYFCKKCSKVYSSMACLVNHNCARHMLINFECNICGEKFETESILWSHTQNHKHQNHKHQNHKHQHQNQKHKTNKCCYCKICGLGFVRENDLSVHISSHKNNSLPQPVAASNPVSTIPLNNIDTGQIQKNCDQEKVVPDESDATITEKEQVEDKLEKSKTENVCTICNRSFSSIGPLKRHVNYEHSEKLFECKICHKKFPSEKGAEGHSKNHRENRPYCCEVCGKGFFKEIAFSKHVSTHARDVPFQCDRCEKKFNQKRSLWNHVARCYKTKRFQCEICNKKYHSEAYLSVHKTIHTGEKNLMCEMCGKTFRGIGTLIIHKRQHTGEKPYHCDICDRRFTQKISFVTHNKRYHM
ncbi:hypothetical protein J437_LFUL011895 [Ladona fulva]|uniref:C2H2-type domain-containing protein n=1 Tax=Ladona fulva TaxID=123851 RepID=A0A8K0KI01_LADFU|nr:hypothetical protein J437_LFUL011895 [Ladona fulva]